VRSVRREARLELVVKLVADGRPPAARLDESVRRRLREKFRLGLFDSRRYVDLDAAERIVGNAAFVAAGLEAQRRSALPVRPWSR